MATEFLVRMGERIEAQRKALGLSRGELARRLPGKVNENQIYRWERGKHQPNPDTLEALAEVLGTTVAALMAPAPQAPVTPDLSRHASESQLDRIEQKLDTILAYWQTVSQDTPDDALAYLQRVTGFMQGVLEQPEPPAKDTAPSPPAAKDRSRRTRRAA